METINNMEEIWQQFETLPIDAKQQVVDFINSLAQHYQNQSKGEYSDLGKDAFVGMWRDRKDMEDSSSWVQRVRKQEWRARNGRNHFD